MDSTERGEYEMKKWWYGIKGIRFHYHGAWSDPEIEIDGTLINACDVEDSFWEWYKDEGGNTRDEKAFAKFMQEHAESVRAYASELAENQRETSNVEMED